MFFELEKEEEEEEEEEEEAFEDEELFIVEMLEIREEMDAFGSRLLE